MDYKSRMLNMIETLEKKQVKFYSKEFGSYLIKEKILEINEKKKGILIHNWMRLFFPFINGAKILWEKIEKGNIEIHGSFFFEIFERAFVHPDETGEDKLWTDEDEEVDKEIMKKHSIFEYITGMDYYITICNDVETGSYQMYYVPEGHVNFKGADTLPKIPLTVEQYLDLMISCYGCDGVRHHLHKPEFYQNPFEVCQELQELKTLFPDLKLILPMI
jgi:hypothetical protein